jgi:hypothetical protein
VAAFSETVEIVEDFNEDEVEIVVEIYEDVVEDDDEDEVVEVEIVAKIVVQDDEDLFFSARESE